jgi:hypothetical protein
MRDEYLECAGLTALCCPLPSVRLAVVIPASPHEAEYKKRRQAAALQTLSLSHWFLN